MWKVSLAGLPVLLISWYFTTTFTTYRPRLRTPPSAQEYKVSEEQLRALNEDGTVQLPGILSPDWLEYMELVVEDRVNNPWIVNLVVKK
jgi:hypothetical protein